MVRVSGYIRAIECLESLSNWCLYFRVFNKEDN